jgi:hypothetical protein
MTPQAAEVPPDAKALVEAILEQSWPTGGSASQYAMAMGIVHAKANELKALLAERDAAAREMLAALDETTLNLKALIQVVDDKVGMPSPGPSGREDALAVVAKAEAICAAARGGAA